MSARHIPCGPFANESERRAAEYLQTRLNGALGAQKWVLLTNLAHGSGAQYLADEVDIVAVGPPGVRVVEVKHWDGSYLRSALPHVVEGEANKLNGKTKRIKSQIERACSLRLPFLEGALLLTRGEGTRYREASERRRIAGVPLFGLPEWKELLETERPPQLSDTQIDQICRALAPAVEAALTGDMRVFGPLIDLERLSPKDDPFHRSYRGRRRPAQDRVILHLYDLSATVERDAEAIARREYDALQRLQKSRWLPSLMDSFQESPSYPGELYFFSYIDSEAAPLSKRATDSGWLFEQRLAFARVSLNALHELHSPGLGTDATPILHRNLNPETIRVRSTDEPLFTGLQFARLADASTITGRVAADFPAGEEYAAPEVRSGGLGACTTASDVFALCAFGRLRPLRLPFRCFSEGA